MINIDDRFGSIIPVDFKRKTIIWTICEIVLQCKAYILRKLNYLEDVLKFIMYMYIYTFRSLRVYCIVYDILNVVHL